MTNIIGENCNKAILKESQVLEIRKIFTGRRGEYTSLGKSYKVSPEAIMAVISKRNWKHI